MLKLPLFWAAVGDVDDDDDNDDGVGDGDRPVARPNHQVGQTKFYRGH
jgi:hypothetical protein